MEKKFKKHFFNFEKIRFSFFDNFFNRYLFWIFKILFKDISNTLVTKKCFILISEFIFASLDRILFLRKISKKTNCVFLAKKDFFSQICFLNIFTSVSLNKNIFSNYNFEDFLSSCFLRENW